MCERYGITLETLLNNYSMAQIALISHVAGLKHEDDEREMEKDKPRSTGRKHILNPNDKDNAQAYMLIATGALKG